MGFTLKKIISAFLMPLSFGLILLFLGLFFLYSKSYKKAKLFLSFGFIWIILISYNPFANSLIKPLEDSYKTFNTQEHKDVKFVLVLGSGHNSNDKLSVISQINTTGLVRLNEGIRIYKELKGSKLILSGFSGADKLSHAEVQRNVALALGVPYSDIIISPKPKDTIEEAIEVKKILNLKPFVLVTSAAHMPRAMAIFENQWLNAIAAPTNFLQTNKFLVHAPNSGELAKTESAMHEYIGSFWLALKELFK